MPFDFKNLKTVTCYDAVTIGIPEIWGVFGDVNDRGSWACYHPREEAGTLFVTSTYRRQDENSGPLTEEGVRHSVNGHIRATGSDDGAMTELAIEPMGRDFLWKRVQDGEEDGVLLRHFSYNFFQSHAALFVHTNLTLAIHLGDVEKPDFRDLIDRMDHEIRNARIEPFGRFYRMMENGQASLDPPE